MKKKLILFIMQTNIYRWLLLKIIPFLRLTTYYPKASGVHFYKSYEALRPGDIVLTDDSLKLTGILIPGVWSHAALCVSKDKNYEMAEMTHENFTRSTYFKVFHESDRVCILRCPDISNDPEYLAKFIERCKYFQDKDYDISFELGVSTLYCSELIYQADFEHRLQVSLEDLAGIGRPYISPDGIYKGKNVVVIYDTKENR